jgi:glycogen operon protein
MSDGDWSNSGQSMLGMHLRTADDEVLVWFNRHAEAHPAQLPDGAWEVGLLSDDQATAPIADGAITLPPRSVVALVRAYIPSNEPPEVPPAPEPGPSKEPPGVPPGGPPEGEPPPVEEPPPNFPPDVPPSPGEPPAPKPGA